MTRLAASRRNQAGVTLIEALVAIAILMIVVTGIASATMVGNRGASGANQAARLNSLASSFGEAVKRLPYVDCADETQYQLAFESSERALQNQGQSLLEQRATLTITGTSSATTPTCPTVDPGVQTVDLEVELNGRTVQRSLVKRSPDPSDPPIDVDFDIEQISQVNSPTDPVNDPLVIWGFQAFGTSDIFQYEWWCDGTWATTTPDLDPPPLPPTVPEEDYFTTYLPRTVLAADATHSMTCDYLAPSVYGQEVTVALRVTEAGTGRVRTLAKPFHLPPTAAPHQPPTASFTVTPASCLVSPCPLATALTFQDTSTAPVDAPIEFYSWDFGDGSQPVYCATPGATCRTTGHTYAGGGTFTVKLTVTDSFGSSAVTPKNVYIDGPAVILPIVPQPSAVGGISATPQRAIGPFDVAFNAGQARSGVGSPPAPHYGITYYSWDFGDGTGVQAGATMRTTTHRYAAVTVETTYMARLTVTAGSASNYADIPITVLPIAPPTNLSNSGLFANADLLWIRDASFGFQWTNIEWGPGQTVSYQIQITLPPGGVSGVCAAIAFSPATRTVAAETSKQPQTYPFTWGPNPWYSKGTNGVCWPNRYEARIRTVVQDGASQLLSAWSNPVSLYPS